MLRILYLGLLCFIVLMWKLNCDMMSDSDTVILLALHGFYICFGIVCVVGIIKNGDFE